MKYRITTLLLAIFLTFIPTLALADLNIVATLPTLGSIASEILGSHGKVQVLVTSNEDPHFVDPRPDFVLKLNQADLLLYNGMELEIGWLPTLQNSARNPKVATAGEAALDCSRFITPLEVPTQKLDRAAGDIHPHGNPHYLYAPNNVELVARGITQKISQLDPENAAEYEKNLSTWVKKMETFTQTQKERFASLPDNSKRFVSYHASTPYLADWLSIKSIATIEPKPGISPNPQHIAKTVANIKATKTRLILQESYQPTATSEKLASMTQAKLVRFPNGPNFAKSENYFQYANALMDAIYEAIK